MLKLVPIFLLLTAAMVVWTVRHRELVRSWHEREAIGTEPRDVAGELRKLAGAPEPQSKPWARQFDQFVNDHPGGQWIVGRCERPGLSEQQAAESAHADAAEQVYPLVLQRVHAGRTDRAWLRTRLRRDVTEGRLDADRCAEQFHRPYGTVWAESVLIDVSPERLDPLVAGYDRELRVHGVRQLRHMAAAGVVVVVTCLGYLLLNHLTRGYFAMRLRLAATMIAAAGVILLV